MSPCVPCIVAPAFLMTCVSFHHPFRFSIFTRAAYSLRRAGLVVCTTSHGFRREVDGSKLDASCIDMVVVTSPPVYINGMGSRPLRELHVQASSLGVSVHVFGRQVLRGTMSCGKAPTPRLQMDGGAQVEASAALHDMLLDLARPIHPCCGTGSNVIEKQERLESANGYSRSLFGKRILYALALVYPSPT